MTPVKNANEETRSAEQPPLASQNASSKQLVKNVLVGYLTTFAMMLTGFFMTPLLVHYLGAAQFGLWSLLLSVLGYIALIEVGTYTTVAKRVAECLANQDAGRLARVVATAAAMYAVMSLITLLVVAALMALAPALYPHLAPTERHTVRIALLLLGAYQCVAFLFAPQSALLFGSGRMDLVSKTSAFINLAQSVANVILAMRGYGVLALCLSAIGGSFTTGLLLRRLVRRSLPDVRLHLRDVSMETAKNLLRYGSRYSIMSIAGTISFSSDVLILSFFLPAAALAQYAVASRLSNIINMVASKPLAPTIPTYAHLEAQGDREGQFRLMISSGVASILISLPFSIAFLFLGGRMINAWVGPGFEQAVPVLALLALFLLIVAPNQPCFNLATATDKNLLMTRIYVPAAFCNVALSVLLTRRLGLIGPALGTLIVVSVMDCAILPAITCRLFGFSVRRYWSHLLTPLLAPSLAGAGVALTLRWLPLPQTRIVAAALLLTLMVVCWTTWFLVSLNAEQRETYLRAVRKRLRRSG